MVQDQTEYIFERKLHAYCMKQPKSVLFLEKTFSKIYS